MVLQQILKPYGIETLKQFARLLGAHEEHARRFWSGRRRLSINAAEAIKKATNGTYSLDYLLSLGPKK